MVCWFEGISDEGGIYRYVYHGLFASINIDENFFFEFCGRDTTLLPIKALLRVAGEEFGAGRLCRDVCMRWDWGFVEVESWVSDFCQNWGWHLLREHACLPIAIF